MQGRWQKGQGAAESARHCAGNATGRLEESMSHMFKPARNPPMGCPCLMPGHNAHAHVPEGQCKGSAAEGKVKL